MKVLELIERLWGRISSQINGFFFERHLFNNLETGFLIRERLHNYLHKKGIKHVIGVFTDFWDATPNVKVRVLVEGKSFEEQMKIWEELSKVGYVGLPIDRTRNVFVSVGL